MYTFHEAWSARRGAGWCCGRAPQVLCLLGPPLWCPDGARGLVGLRGTVAGWVNRHTARFRPELPELKACGEPGGLGVPLRDGRVLLALLHSLHPAECPHPAVALGGSPLGSQPAAGSDGGRGLGLSASEDEADWEEAWRVGVSLANHTFGVPRLIDVSVRGFWQSEVHGADSLSVSPLSLTHTHTRTPSLLVSTNALGYVCASKNLVYV